MEEKDNTIVKWAQEDVKTSNKVLNSNNIYIYIYMTILEKCAKIQAHSSKVSLSKESYQYVYNYEICKIHGSSTVR